VCDESPADGVAFARLETSSVASGSLSGLNSAFAHPFLGIEEP
jgi:hypothetical protein